MPNSHKAPSDDFAIPHAHPADKRHSSHRQRREARRLIEEETAPMDNDDHLYGTRFIAASGEEAISA